MGGVYWLAAARGGAKGRSECCLMRVLEEDSETMSWRRDGGECRGMVAIYGVEK